MSDMADVVCKLERCGATNIEVVPFAYDNGGRCIAYHATFHIEGLKISGNLSPQNTESDIESCIAKIMGEWDRELEDETWFHPSEPPNSAMLMGYTRLIELGYD